jgi:hypothetical protein
MADALGRRHLPEKRPRAGRLCQLGGASLSVERDRLPHRHGGGERDRPQVVVEDEVRALSPAEPAGTTLLRRRG